MKKHITSLINDTLKKDGKWSRTSLTMFSAWKLVIFMVIFDLYKEGFRYDVFVTMVGVALGTKLTDSIGKRVEKK
jgi:hypothetical protein